MFIAAAIYLSCALAFDRFSGGMRATRSERIKEALASPFLAICFGVLLIAKAAGHVNRALNPKV